MLDDLVDFSTIDVLDVGSLSNASTPDGTWYKQKTTGVTPKARLDACVVMAAAPDNSSHNIYLYGGRDGTNTYYDETWVLTVPSFQWRQVHSGTSPRYSMTCHVAGNRQMITTGGSDTSNLTSGCDWHTRGVGVLDMSSITWSSSYDALAKPYVVPDLVVAMIGGNPEGNATMVEPIGGLSDAGLKELFHPSSSKITASSSSKPSASGSIGTSGSPVPELKKEISIGTIAGGIVAGLVALAGLLALVLFILRRKKPQKTQDEQIVPELEATYQDHPVLDSAPIYEKSGLSSTTTELDASNTSLALDRKGVTVNVKPVELEGDHVLGVVAFKVPSREGVTRPNSVHSKMSGNGRYSPLPMRTE